LLDPECATRPTGKKLRRESGQGGRLPRAFQSLQECGKRSRKTAEISKYVKVCKLGCHNQKNVKRKKRGNGPGKPGAPFLHHENRKTQKRTLRGYVRTSWAQLRDVKRGPRSDLEDRRGSELTTQIDSKHFLGKIRSAPGTNYG